jgi:hypothetical protein
MYRSSSLMRGASVAALLALTAAPTLAFPGKADRAQAAIAAAQAKIDAANKVGASGQVPEMQAHAQAALATAKEDLASGHKEDAIADATHAGELADGALGQTHRNTTEAARAATADAAQAASDAQQQAAAANSRADSAEQAAATAQAQADAARNAPPVVAAVAPAPTTTVTVERQTASAAPAHVTHRVVHHTGTATTQRVAERTTVTTTPSN